MRRVAAIGLQSKTGGAADHGANMRTGAAACEAGKIRKITAALAAYYAAAAAPRRSPALLGVA